MKDEPIGVFSSSFILHPSSFSSETSHAAQARPDADLPRSQRPGGPAVRPGKADASLIIEKLVSKKMPPTPEKLSDAQIARIRQWIDGSTEFASPTEADILPVMQMRCVVCHGKRKQEGGLDLRTRAAAL